MFMDDELKLEEVTTPDERAEQDRIKKAQSLQEDPAQMDMADTDTTDGTL